MRQAVIIWLMASVFLFAACGKGPDNETDCETARFESWGPTQMLLLMEILQSRTAASKVKIGAIRKLVEIGDQRAVSALVGVLDETESPETIRAAVEGLVLMGAKTVSVLEKERQQPAKGTANRFREEKIDQILQRLKAD